MTDLATLVPETFDALIGERFAVNDIGDVLQLIEVQRLQSPSPRPQAFSLLFVAPRHQLQQATFALQHEQLGRIDLFLVPLQPDARGRLYEAVFN